MATHNKCLVYIIIVLILLQFFLKLHKAIADSKLGVYLNENNLSIFKFSRILLEICKALTNLRKSWNKLQRFALLQKSRTLFEDRFAARKKPHLSNVSWDGSAVEWITPRHALNLQFLWILTLLDSGSNLIKWRDIDK